MVLITNTNDSLGQSYSFTIDSSTCKLTQILNIYCITLKLSPSNAYAGKEYTNYACVYT
jgi:hypothetical protein